MELPLRLSCASALLPCPGPWMLKPSHSMFLAVTSSLTSTSASVRALFSSEVRHSACAKLSARSSRGRCILPLAVNTAASAPLMICRFGTAAVVWERILRPQPSPSRHCLCSKTSCFRRHCSSGFSLRWPAHRDEGTRITPGGHQSLTRTILDS
jgi:hypothetical protein